MLIARAWLSWLATWPRRTSTLRSRRMAPSWPRRCRPKTRSRIRRLSDLADDAVGTAGSQSVAVPASPDEQPRQLRGLDAAAGGHVPQAKPYRLHVIAEQVVAVAVGVAPFLLGRMGQAAVDLDAEPERLIEVVEEADPAVELTPGLPFRLRQAVRSLDVA